METEIITLGFEDYLVNDTILSNFTIKTPYRRTLTSNIIGSFITIVIALTSILGNIAVVTASFWSETLRVQTGNLLVVYLSIIDILTAILVMIPSAIAVAIDYWPLGWRACKMHAGFNYTFACSSSFNLALISFDRAIAVLHPFKYRTMMTTKVMIGGCCLIFFQSFAIGLACGLPYWSHYDYTEGVCAMDYTRNMAVFNVFNIGCFFCYYVPAIIISICNVLIILAANKSGKSLKPLFVRRNNNSVEKPGIAQGEAHMNKTFKSMVVVVVTYYICFSPYALSKEVKGSVPVADPQERRPLRLISAKTSLNILREKLRLEILAVKSPHGISVTPF
ncbi:5-hydroxytryptamine receptor 4, partial [Stegodyphus mimosarum]